MRLSGNIMQKHWLGLKIDSFWVQTNSRSNKLNQCEVEVTLGRICSKHCFCPDSTDTANWSNLLPQLSRGKLIKLPHLDLLPQQWAPSSGCHIGCHQLWLILSWPPAPTYCWCYETPQLISAHSEKLVIWRFSAIDPEGTHSLLLRWIRETAIFNVLFPNFTSPHWPADQCYVNKPTDWCRWQFMASGATQKDFELTWMKQIHFVFINFVI